MLVLAALLLVARPAAGFFEAAGGRDKEEADVAWMLEARELALRAAGQTAPNPVVGCASPHPSTWRAAFQRFEGGCLSSRGSGSSGVLVARDGRTVLGRGFHPKAGEPHAEIFALRDSGAVVELSETAGEWRVENAEHLAGATAFVTLEPCSHTGKTPPCCNALIAARVGRVVVGMSDPAPWVAGAGIESADHFFHLRRRVFPLYHRLFKSMILLPRRRLRAAGIDVDVGVQEAACAEINAEWIANLPAE